MRSNKTANGFQHLCASEAGGGQGNCLTGGAFAILINSALKEVERQYEVTVRAIADDIYIWGSPSEVFGADGRQGALELLLELLAESGLQPNLSKFQAYGTSAAARAAIPDYIKQPSVETTDESTTETTTHFGLFRTS